MAQGTITVFDEFLPQANYANSALSSTAAGISMDTDTFSFILISDDIDTVLASAATPDRADFTECSAGGGYSTGGATATITVSEAAGTLTVALASNVVWTSGGTGGPADIRCALLVSDTHTGTQDAVLVMDMTTNSGTTPLDLDAGDITINSGDLFTIA
jgi:hypothetical protein